MRNIVFFLGKGGVGKTTSSVSFSHYLSDKGFSVYLASVDPAHNICDILSIEPFRGAKEVYRGFLAEEIDVDAYLKDFIRQTTNRMKDMYRYLQIINLDKMLDVMRYSPGMEEYAIMYAIKEKIEANGDKDFIVIDTPPTGLMLKIFALPFTSKMWIEKLVAWRKRIVNARAAIANINPSAIGEDVALKEEDDKVLKELGIQSRTIEFMVNLLKDRSKTKTVIVLNRDKLSLNESLRIKEGLEHLGIPLSMVLINKIGLSTGKADVEYRFGNVPARGVPFVEGGLLDRNRMVELASDWAEELIR